MSGRTSRSLLGSASIVSAAYLASRLMGYGREALLAAQFGATHTTDAYLVAQEIPNFLFAAVGSALVMVFIPIYRELAVRAGDHAADQLFRRTLAVVSGGAVLLMLIGWVAAPALLPALVPGLPDPVQRLAVTLTAIMMPMIPLLGASSALTAVLNGRWHFAVPAFVPLIGNLFVVGMLLVVRRPEQITWVATAAVAGAAAGLLIQVPAVRAHGVQLWSRQVGQAPAAVNRALGQIWRLVLPVALTAGATQLQSFATRFFASGLSPGSISALNYASRVNSVPYGVVGVALATVLYPGMAEQAAAGRIRDLRQTVGDGLRMLAFILLPMAAGLYVFREPAIRLFLERGAFDPQATAMTAGAIRYYAPGILFFGWLDFLSRSFVVVQETLTPLWAGIGMLAASLALNQLLVGPMAQGGLALSATLASGLAVAFLLWRLRQRLGPYEGWRVAGAVLTSLVTSGLGAAVGWQVYTHLPGASDGAFLVQALCLAAGLAALLAVHVGLGMLLGGSEGRRLLAGLRARFARRP